jgi:Lipoprotein LpqB beta-propeller domain
VAGRSGEHGAAVRDCAHEPDVCVRRSPLDRRHSIRWAADLDDAGTLSGGPSDVTAPWLDGRQVVNLSVSPDATRLAVLSKLPNDTDYRLDVAGIVRKDTGMAAALAEPYRQGEPLVRFVDVTWLDQVTMAVLAREKEGAPLRPFKVDLGQGVGLRRVGQFELDQTLIKELPNATSLTSRGGVRGLVVMTPQAAFLRAGNAWAQQSDASEIIVGGN